MASFYSVNYALRVNKAIERRLMFRALDGLREFARWDRYTYFGMGSMWFVDFLMAHRVLGIRRLVSCELEEEHAKRARSNRPLGGIKVLAGDLGEHLRSRLSPRSKLLSWMDYDKPVSEDSAELIANVSERASNLSSLIVSFPASFPRHCGRDHHQKLDGLREIFGPAVPHGMSKKDLETTDLSRYPSRLADILWAHIERSGNRRSDSVRPMRLFSFVYSDRQPMATVGVLYVSKRIREDVAAVIAASPTGYLSHETTQICAPLLTAREKVELDRLLPTKQPISVARAARARVHLPQTELAHYTRWYNEYPVYAEVEPR